MFRRGRIDQRLILKFLCRQLSYMGGILQLLQRRHTCSSDKTIGRRRVRSQHVGRGSEQGDGSERRNHETLHGKPPFGLEPWKSLHRDALARTATRQCELLHILLMM